MSKNEIPFYDDLYVSIPDAPDADTVDMSNPVSIYNYLLENVYGQDGYCRDASMILYDHQNGITSRNMVCGPSGCGKTYVWDCLKKVYPRIIVVDASTITKDGWNGSNKTAGFLDHVDPDNPDFIIVFDEFDKCATPSYSKSGENVSASVQSEFLKMVEGETIKRQKGGSEITIDTSRMSFVFCGSFAVRAEQIAESRSESGFGFDRNKEKHTAFEKELTVNDIMEAGVIRELASRITRIVNLRVLSLDDYEYLISEHGGSPIKKLEEKYDMKLDISEETKHRIAKEAFESGLGVRNAYSKLQRMMDNTIFELFLENKGCPKTIVLD